MRLGGEVQNWLSKKLICLRKASQLCLLLKCSKVIGNGIIRKLGYGFLFTFHSNYCHIFSCFNTMHECDRDPDRHCMTTRAALYTSLGCSVGMWQKLKVIALKILSFQKIFAARCYASAALAVLQCLCVHHVRALCQNE